MVLGYLLSDIKNQRPDPMGSMGYYGLAPGHGHLPDRQASALPRYSFQLRCDRRPYQVANRFRFWKSWWGSPLHRKTRPGSRRPLAGRLFAPTRKPCPCGQDINEYGWLPESPYLVSADMRQRAILNRNSGSGLTIQQNAVILFRKFRNVRPDPVFL